jgi:hypothetical protein
VPEDDANRLLRVKACNKCKVRRARSCLTQLYNRKEGDSCYSHSFSRIQTQGSPSYKHRVCRKYVCVIVCTRCAANVLWWVDARTQARVPPRRFASYSVSSIVRFGVRSRPHRPFLVRASTV